MYSEYKLNKQVTIYSLDVLLSQFGTSHVRLWGVVSLELGACGRLRGQTGAHSEETGSLMAFTAKKPGTQLSAGLVPDFCKQ